MPCAYHIAPEDGLIIIKGSNPMTLTQMEETGRQLLQDPKFDPHLAQIVDFRDVDLPRDYEANQDVGNFLTKTYSETVQVSIAVVVNGEQAPIGIAELYKLVCTMDNTELFDNYDHAMRWLMRREFVQQTHHCSKTIPKQILQTVPQNT